MDDLQKRFLQAAYKLGINRPAHQVELDEIADELGLEHSVFPYRAPLDTVAQYLGTRGFIKKQTSAYEILSLTRTGIEEAERAADPVEQRKERRRVFLRTVYDLADGNPAEYVYWRNVAPEMGWDPTNREHEKQGVALAEYAERSGLITIEGNRGIAYKITEKGVDVVEGNKPPDAGSSSIHNWNIGQAPGANFNTGTQGDIDMSGASYDFRSIEEKIDRFAANPAEAEEFKAALAELRRQMEEDGAIKGGSLSQANDKMQKAGWLTSPLAGIVMRFLFGV